MGEIETVYICVHARMPSCFSCVRLFVTPGTVAYQAPLSIDSPGQDTGVGCHALPQGLFLTQGLKQHHRPLLHSRWVLYPPCHEKCWVRGIYVWKDWCWSCSCSILVIWCTQTTHWKRPWCWERSRPEGGEGIRGWDGWAASCNERELGQTPEDGEGQESLVCCSPWGHKKLDVAAWLNTNRGVWRYMMLCGHKRHMIWRGSLVSEKAMPEVSRKMSASLPGKKGLLGRTEHSKAGKRWGWFVGRTWGLLVSPEHKIQSEKYRRWNQRAVSVLLYQRSYLLC